MNTFSFLLICVVFVLCGIRMSQTGSGSFFSKPGKKTSPEQQRRYRLVGMLMVVGFGTLGVMAVLSVVL